VISMKTPERIKREKIAHLNWCLEKLKFFDQRNDDDCEQLYRDIYSLISSMEKLEAIAAYEHYHQRMLDGTLILRLQRYNIELNV